MRWLIPLTLFALVSSALAAGRTPRVRRGGKDKIAMLLGEIARRPRADRRYEQRTIADIVTLLAIAGRHRQAAAVEERIVQTLAARQAARPRDGDFARRIVYALENARGHWVGRRTGRSPRPSKADVLNGPAAQAFLLAMLDHPTAEVRADAARALGDRGTPELVLRALRGDGIRAGHRPVVWRALLETTLILDHSLRGEAIFREVRRLSKDEHASVRAAAKTFLQRVPR